MNNTNLKGFFLKNPEHVKNQIIGDYKTKNIGKLVKKLELELF